MIIVITLPDFIPNESERIVELFSQRNVDLVHLRKPQSMPEEMEELIMKIPVQYHNRLVLHDHHHLAVKYGLYGVHLNSRNSMAPQGWQGSVSRSCHSFDEVKAWKKRCNYVSLSPIFDSISKQGYYAAFSVDALRQALLDGVIDSKVLALGGITFEKVDEIMNMGFGGAMILGDAWKEDKK